MRSNQTGNSVTHEKPQRSPINTQTHALDGQSLINCVSTPSEMQSKRSNGGPAAGQEREEKCHPSAVSLLRAN